MALINIGDVELYYKRQGTGPALVFAAGLGGQGSYWQNQIDDFAKDFTVIAFDHRGVGKSGAAAPPFSISGLAKDVIGLMDGLELDQAIYVGHSTGGAMGQYLAAHYPERFRAMVLSATWRKADARFRAVFEARKESVLEMGNEGYAKHSLVWLYPNDWFEKNADQLVDIVAKSAKSQPPQDVLVGRLEAITESDHSGVDLSGKIPPILITYAEDDILVPPLYPEALRLELPAADSYCFASGGHHFPVSRTKEFNTELRRFFNKIEL